jgi:hypothetical protein
MISELIEHHIEETENFPNPEDNIPHVISEVHDTKANIEMLRTSPSGIDQMLFLDLSDGSQFTITVSEVA